MDNSTPRTDRSSSSSAPSRLVVGVALLAVAAAALALLSPFGTRWDWWHFRTGFSMLRWAAFAGIAVGVLSLVAVYRTRLGAPRKGLSLAHRQMILDVRFVSRVGRGDLGVNARRVRSYLEEVRERL